jgi:GTP cyclohydrolase II
MSPRQSWPAEGDDGLGAQFLHHLGVRRLRPVTTAERHLAAITGHGLEVVGRVKPAVG